MYFRLHGRWTERAALAHHSTQHGTPHLELDVLGNVRLEIDVVRGERDVAWIHT